MEINRFEIWIADLNPRIGGESGKKRPVLVIQTNMLNNISHPSTIICPITSNVQASLEILRVHIKAGTANLTQDCDIMPDQLRAIDNSMLIKKLGTLPPKLREKVEENLKIILDLP